MKMVLAYRKVFALIVFVVTAVFLCSCGEKKSADLGAVSGGVLLADGKAGEHGGTTVFMPGTSYSARTDEQGRWTMTSLPSGMYQIVAEHAGYRTVNMGVQTVDAALHQPGRALMVPTVILELDEAATTESRVGLIMGVVSVLDAQDSAGVRVLLEGTDKTTQSDEAGNYAFAEVDPGRYVLTFRKTGYQEKQTSLLVRAGKNPSEPRAMFIEPLGGSQVLAQAKTSATLTRANVTSGTRTLEDNLVEERLRGSGTISGTVQAADEFGTPITDLSRVVMTIDNSDYQVLPDAEGRFQFSRLPSGTYRIYAVLDLGAGMASVDVDLTQQIAASVTLKVSLSKSPEPQEGAPGTVHGTVALTAPDGTAEENASGVAVGCVGTNAAALTKNDGSFTLTVPEGQYTLQFSKQGYNTEQMQGVDVVRGEDTDIGTVALTSQVDAPFVASTWPADDEKEVLISAKLTISVLFSKPMNVTSVYDNVKVIPARNVRLFMGAGSHTAANEQTLVIEVDNTNGDALNAKEQFHISVGQACTDLSGNKLRAAHDFRFTLGGYGIVATNPANDSEVNYKTGTMHTVDIYFNCKLDPQSINERTLSIAPNINAVSSPPSIRNDNVTGWSVLRFTPYVQGNKEYRITVNRGLRTTGGKPVSDLPYSFRYRLNDVAPTGMPNQATRNRR